MVIRRVVIVALVALVPVAAVHSQAASAPPAPTGDARDLPADVLPNHWAATSVRRALSLKLIDLDKGKFEGAQTASRLDLAAAVGGVLERTAKSKVKSQQPPKDLPPAYTHAKAVGLAVGSGAVKIRKGRPGWEQPATRDELAVAISKLLALVKNQPEGPVTDPVELNDVPPDSPLYIPIQRSVKAKMISLNANKYEGYIGVSRYQLVAVIVRFLDPKATGK